MLRTGLGSGGGGGYGGGPGCPHPFPPLPCGLRRRTPGPLRLATSGSSPVPRSLERLERQGECSFTGPNPRKSWGFPLPATRFLFCNLNYLSQ